MREREDALRYMRGAVTVEKDLVLKAGDHLHVAGWLRRAGDAESAIAARWCVLALKTFGNFRPPLLRERLYWGHEASRPPDVAHHACAQKKIPLRRSPRTAEEAIRWRSRS